MEQQIRSAETTTAHSVSIVRYGVIAAVFWSLLIAYSLLWDHQKHREEALLLGKMQARAFYEKDLLYRRWVSRHGGVYVPVSEFTQPNPNLSHVPERDITTPSGRQLTLVNPAYMMRQTFEMAQEYKGSGRGHITSLKPIRPENAPDPWEKEALLAFERGVSDVGQLVQIDGKPYYRYMKSLITDKPCLKCHQSQGYHEGDVRGGLSVSVDMEPVNAMMAKEMQGAYLNHAVIWILGLSVIVFGTRRLNRNAHSLLEKSVELEHEVEERTIAQEQLQEQAAQLEEEIGERQMAQEALQEQTDELLRVEQVQLFLAQACSGSTEDEPFFSKLARYLSRSLDMDYVCIDRLEGDGLAARTVAVWCDDHFDNNVTYTLKDTPCGDVIGKDVCCFPSEVSRLFPRDQVLQDLRAESYIGVTLWSRTNQPIGLIAVIGRKPLLNQSLAETILKLVTVRAASELERLTAEEERIKLESQLYQSQKMESVGRLAGGVAHDFNNLLTIILGYTQMSLMNIDQTHPLHGKLEEIRKAAERSADLTQQLLAFARKQTISPRVLNMNEAVSGIFKMLQRLIGEDINLIWQPGEGVWPVKIDPSQLDQILANLCVNARDSITGVGKITIETGNVIIDEDYCSHHVDVKPGAYVRLVIADTGCGMDKTVLSQIFEPFFTTKEMGKGTGLGLATVYGIVKQNNGFINVSSEPGLGTIFNVYIPRHAVDDVQISAEEVLDEASGGTETILLVEDELVILNMVTTMLTQMGYKVLQAGTPSEAIRLANEHSGEVCLLMTDVIMPEMNGKELCDKLKSLNPELKCLYMSGYTADVVANRGMLDENVHFIQKPFSLTSLAVKLREVLDSK